MGEWQVRGQDLSAVAPGSRGRWLSGDGKVVATGTPDGSGGLDVRVFVAADGPGGARSWLEAGALVANTDGNSSSFDAALSGDGATLAIAAHGDALGAYHEIEVYGFAADGSWARVGGDVDGGENPGLMGGKALDLSDDGTCVAVAAPYDGGSGDTAGYVRVFAFDGADWAQRGADIGGDASAQRSGESVAASGDCGVVAVSAFYGAGASMAGRVRAFAWDGAEWRQRGNDLNGTVPWNLKGSSIALSSDGSTIAVGAVHDDGESQRGHLWVHAWDGAGWRQRGEDVDGVEASDRSSYALSLSGDGTVVAASARYVDPRGRAAGHARVMAYDGGGWSQVGGDLDPPLGIAGVDGSRTTYSVSLSADGAAVAVGAEYAVGAGGVGGVRVYDWVADDDGGSTPKAATKTIDALTVAVTFSAAAIVLFIIAVAGWGLRRSKRRGSKYVLIPSVNPADDGY